MDEHMQFGLVSDIHGNFQALQYVVKRLKTILPPGSWILNAGDNVGYGEQPEECVRFLMDAEDIITVQGNYDRSIANYRNDSAKYIKKWTKARPEKLAAIQRDSQQLSGASCEWLLSLPVDTTVRAGDILIGLSHYSPDSRDSIAVWTTDNQLKMIAARTNCDVIVSGHTHSVVTKVLAGKLFINPGTVGRSPLGLTHFATMIVCSGQLPVVKQYGETIA